MSKSRPVIPKGVSDAVLKEYNHRCSMCGHDKPHLHHIDENPSNNDPSNLLPLCPNCHLLDTHDPTAPIDPNKIRLFRRCKDPAIFDPRFEPLWKRLKFLRLKEINEVVQWEYSCHDLKSFLRSLKMGEYYSSRVAHVLQRPLEHATVELIRTGKAKDQDQVKQMSADLLHSTRASIIEDLCVELLRFQEWSRLESRNHQRG
jgi:hypothetical protein